MHCIVCARAFQLLKIASSKPLLTLSKYLLGQQQKCLKLEILFCRLPTLLFPFESKPLSGIHLLCFSAVWLLLAVSFPVRGSGLNCSNLKVFALLGKPLPCSAVLSSHSCYDHWLSYLDFVKNISGSTQVEAQLYQMLLEERMKLARSIGTAP